MQLQAGAQCTKGKVLPRRKKKEREKQGKIKVAYPCNNAHHGLINWHAGGTGNKHEIEDKPAPDMSLWTSSGADSITEQEPTYTDSHPSPDISDSDYEPHSSRSSSPSPSSNTSSIEP